MKLTDLITLLVLVATIISSHWLASKQTRNTKRVKWVEDFRAETANYIALSNLVNPKKIDTLYELSKSGFVVLMLLDDRKKDHKILNDDIAAFGMFSATYSGGKYPEYEEGIGKLYV
jgi:hypothetical protein